MIRVCEPTITAGDREAIKKCVDEGWISSAGPWLKTFEENFCTYFNCRHSIALSNGTAAIEAALYGIGIGCGDEVILPSFNIISGALATLRLGAVPTFVDVDSDTWCLDPMLVENAITPKTRAIIVVHMYGHPAEMDELMRIAKKHKLKIIEDAAQVHGAEYRGKKCGTIGDVGTFSFYANKLVTTGEGGMVVTSDDHIARRVRSYINLCFGKSDRYLHEDIGYNFRMTSMQAALGNSQLSRLDSIVEKKRSIGLIYKKYLSEDKSLQLQIQLDNVISVYWMYCVVLPNKGKIFRDTVQERLLNLGIETRSFFTGMHQQPALSGLNIAGAFPVTEYLSSNGFYLPSSQTLEDADVKEICHNLHKVIAETS